MLLPTLSLPTKEIVREHTPPKPKRSKENDSSKNSTQEMENDEGQMDEPNDVSISTSLVTFARLFSYLGGCFVSKFQSLFKGTYICHVIFHW
jgi:hypothetical protein